MPQSTLNIIPSFEEFVKITLENLNLREFYTPIKEYNDDLRLQINM